MFFFPCFMISNSLNKGFQKSELEHHGSFSLWTFFLTVCRNLALYNFDTWPFFHPWISSVAGEIHHVNKFSTGGAYLGQDPNVVSYCAGKNGHDGRLWSFFASSTGIWCWYFSWSEWNQGAFEFIDFALICLTCEVIFLWWLHAIGKLNFFKKYMHPDESLQGMKFHT